MDGASILIHEVGEVSVSSIVHVRPRRQKRGGEATHHAERLCGKLEAVLQETAVHIPDPPLWTTTSEQGDGRKDGGNGRVSGVANRQRLSRVGWRSEHRL